MPQNSYVFGINIFADKLHALDARSRCSRILLDKAPRIWSSVKGTPRPSETYRGARHNAPRELRRIALWHKRRLHRSNTKM